MAKSIFRLSSSAETFFNIFCFVHRAPGSTSYTPAQGAYNYGTPQRAAGYPDQSAGYAAASQTYPSEFLLHNLSGGSLIWEIFSAAPQPTYDYGYARPAQTYDTTKTYYQQAGASYVAAPSYVDSNAAKATYTQPPTRAIQQKVTQYSAPSQSKYKIHPSSVVCRLFFRFSVAPANKQQAPNTPAAYSSYDNALYSATVYMAQQNNKTTNPNQQQQQQQQPGWQKKGATFKQRQKVANSNKVQQVHYCDVCRISCAGPQTYREHLEGQKHKKREALQKAQQDPQAQAQVQTVRGSNLRCELCDVTCTGNDAYSAHVRGSKHQKVVKLHTKLGKPIPSAEPTPIGTTKEKDGDNDDVPVSEDIKPVGEEYIEEMKDADGKIVTFNCKLCDCKFNDPNAKEMHTKGRRHRLQYKKKVQPDLIVDVKPTLRQRKMAEREKQRHQMQEDFWNRRRESEMDDEERMFWEERRRFEEECGGSGEGQPWARNFPAIRGGRAPLGGFPMFNNGRRIESLDDRHVVARHAEIYPKEEELQSIQKIVSHTERALKLVSDAMTEVKPIPDTPVKPAEEKMETLPSAEETESKDSVTAENKNGDSKENGNQNQMISFQKETEGTIRLLKGVMRVGLLAKGLNFSFASSSSFLQLSFQVYCFKATVLSNWWFCALRSRRRRSWNASFTSCRFSWRKSLRSRSTASPWLQLKVPCWCPMVVLRLKSPWRHRCCVNRPVSVQCEATAPFDDNESKRNEKFCDFELPVSYFVIFSSKWRFLFFL